MVGRIAEEMENIESDFIEIRDIPYAQAKREIAKYFRDNDGQEIDYIEIVDDLRLPLPQVVKVCEDLEKEGKIGAVD